MTRTSVVTVFAIALAGAAFSACTRDASVMRTGDEPPIRVRGGTMHLDLLAAGETDFEPDNPSDKKKWHIKGTPRRNRNFFLIVVVSADPNCNGKVTSANKVDIAYTGGQNVEFKSNNNNVKITAQQDLEHPSAKWLKYEAAGGYISAVKVDNQDLCTFGAKDTTLQIFLLD